MAAGGALVLLEIRRGERIAAVLLSNGETLEVAPEALPPDLPAAGTEVSAALLESLREAAARKRVARRVFELLGQRLRSVARLSAKLTAEGFAPSAVAAVLEQFAREGLVDDRGFAEAFCRDALRARAVGSLWLRARLAAQGVGAADAQAALSSVLPPGVEAEQARCAAAKRWRRLEERGPAAQAKVARFLVARGFPPALARRAARETVPDDPVSDQDDSQEEEW